MASKAGKLKQKAFSVVDNVPLLSSHNPSNSCTITVKSSPPRSAEEVTKISVRRGWMLKRNEQRSWQRRYCCLVPHTFLYYFENKDSEAPRGVIDLECYTDIGVDSSTGAIMLGPGAGASSGLRNYYFRPEERKSRGGARGGGGAGSGGGGGSDSCRRGGEPRSTFFEEASSGGGDDDGGVFGEWLSGLHRERYKVVRDERDAYMNLQEDFMAQMQNTTLAMSEAESERGRILEGMRAEQAAARAVTRDGLEQARALFREEGLPQEEASSLPLPALLARVRAVASERRSREERLQAELESALASAREARGVEGDSRGTMKRLQAEVDELSARAESTESRLQQAEEAAARQRSMRAAAEEALASCSSRLEAALLDAEQGQVNLGIMAGERRAALAKATELSEQKRLLVREVKAARSSLAEASAINRRLARAYETLDRTLRASSTSLASSQPQVAGGVGSGASAGGGSTAMPATAVDEPATEGVSLAEAEPGITVTVSPGDTVPPSPDSSISSQPAADDWRETRVNGLVGASASSGSGTRTSAVGRGKSTAGTSGAPPAEGVLQVRNLSTGDVDVVVPGEEMPGGAGGAGGRKTTAAALAATAGAGAGAATSRERASTEGDAAPIKPPASSRDSLGSKISQGFASASWRWGGTKGGGGAASAGAKATEYSVTPFPRKNLPSKTGGAGAGSPDGKGSETPKAGSSVNVFGRRGSGSGLAGGATVGAMMGGRRHSVAGNASGGSGTGAVPTISLSDLEGDDLIAPDVASADRDGDGDGDGDGSGAGKSNPLTMDETADDGHSVPGSDARSGSALETLALADGSQVLSPRRRSAGSTSGMSEDSGDKGVGGDRSEEERRVRDEVAHKEVGSAGVGMLLCRRCGGTVEGPLHSTCACAVPDLGDNPEEVGPSAQSERMSTLKGVWKSFGGRVVVARQMFDSALRQNSSSGLGGTGEQSSSQASTSTSTKSAPALAAEAAPASTPAVGAVSDGGTDGAPGTTSDATFEGIEAVNRLRQEAAGERGARGRSSTGDEREDLPGRIAGEEKGADVADEMPGDGDVLGESQGNIAGADVAEVAPGDDANSTQAICSSTEALESGGMSDALVSTAASPPVGLGGQEAMDNGANDHTGEVADARGDPGAAASEGVGAGVDSSEQSLRLVIGQEEPEPKTHPAPIDLVDANDGVVDEAAMRDRIHDEKVDSEGRKKALAGVVDATNEVVEQGAAGTNGETVAAEDGAAQVACADSVAVGDDVLGADVAEVSRESESTSDGDSKPVLADPGSEGAVEAHHDMVAEETMQGDSGEKEHLVTVVSDDVIDAVTEGTREQAHVSQDGTRLVSIDPIDQMNLGGDMVGADEGNLRATEETDRDDSQLLSTGLSEEVGDGAGVVEGHGEDGLARDGAESSPTDAMKPTDTVADPRDCENLGEAEEIDGSDSQRALTSVPEVIDVGEGAVEFLGEAGLAGGDAESLPTDSMQPTDTMVDPHGCENVGEAEEIDGSDSQRAPTCVPEVIDVGAEVVETHRETGLADSMKPGDELIPASVAGDRVEASRTDAGDSQLVPTSSLLEAIEDGASGVQNQGGGEYTSDGKSAVSRTREEDAVQALEQPSYECNGGTGGTSLLTVGKDTEETNTEVAVSGDERLGD